MDHELTEFPRRAPISSLPVDVDDEATRKIWCVELGITEHRLLEAVASVGRMPAALRFFLTSTGAPVKALTSNEIEQRAFRARQRGLNLSPNRERS
jgi:hypothetical protein